MFTLPTPTPSTLVTISLEEVISKARKAQVEWGYQSFAVRRSVMEKIKRNLIDNADKIAEIVAKCTGKSHIDAFCTEVFPSALSCDWYGKNAEKILGSKRVPVSSWIFSQKRSSIERVPVGVVGIISPWNYPFAIPFGEIIMGLMAGNAIILKVANNVEPVGDMIEEILRKSHLPTGLFHHVKGLGPVISEQMFAGGINKLFFTGSVAVGKELMKKASSTLTPLSLELGGNDPMIVFKDAELERAANGAVWGGFQNAGQTCGGVERVYVDESIYEEFINLLIQKTKSLRHGKTEGSTICDVGAVTTQNQFATISRQVNEALAKGARIIAQSQPVGSQDGLFYPATLMVDVEHSMEIMREETFGPVLCVMPFQNLDEALRLANDSHLALTSSVWSKNLEEAKKFAKKLETGVTTINDHLYTHGLPELPWGGWKSSGLGRTHGTLGLEEMTHAKVINWDVFPTKRAIYWFPIDRDTLEGVRAALYASFSTSQVQRLRNLVKLIPIALNKMFRGM